MALSKLLEEQGILFILVYINEAHSSAWPVGLPDQVDPHTCFEDRLTRAQQFYEEENPEYPFVVLVDGWENEFDDKFRTWPDKYYFIDDQYTVLAKSEYGAVKDAVINKDCLVLLKELLGI